jgi:hypothetical protein
MIARTGIIPYRNQKRGLALKMAYRGKWKAILAEDEVEALDDTPGKWYAILIDPDLLDIDDLDYFTLE